MGLRVVVTKGYTTTTQIPIPKELDKTEGAIREKAMRLGLEVVVFLARFFTTTSQIALKIYADAIKQKLRRMGVLVVVQNPQRHTTTSVPPAG